MANGCDLSDLPAQFSDSNKDEQFRDNPMNPDWKPGDLPNARQLGWFTEDQPGIHEIVREMRAVVDHYGERVLIGEIYLPLVRLMHYALIVP